MQQLNMPNPFMLIPKTPDLDAAISAASMEWRHYPSEPSDLNHQLQQAQPIVRHTVTKKSGSSTGSRRDYVAWSKRETEGLVQWLDLRDNFSAMKRNTAQMLPQLAGHLQKQISGCTKTAKQCDHKIRNLKKCYKKVKEKLNSAGPSFETVDSELQEEILDQFPYFREFERIMREEHTIKSIPSALLRLAAEGGPTRVKICKAPSPRERKRDFTEFQDDTNLSSASHTPVLSSSQEPEFPDMTRFRSIRSKEASAPLSKPFHVVEPCTSLLPSAPYLDHATYDLDASPRYPPPALSPDSLPDVKKQIMSPAPSFFSPYEMLDSMFIPEIESLTKCTIPDDQTIESPLPTCPLVLDAPQSSLLFGPPGGYFNMVDTPSSDTTEYPEESSTHSTLLNILQGMARLDDVSPFESIGKEFGVLAETPTTQESALLLAENIKSVMAEKEATNRQKMYLNHLQSQIQRHTLRVEMLYSNGQIARAAEVMDKIDELEQELHNALSKASEHF